MNPHPTLRRPHLFITGAIAVVVTLACGAPAAFEDPPAEKVAFKDVVGMWKAGVTVIDFHDDGTFALTSANANNIALQDKGT